MEISKQYDPKKVEDEIYKNWEKSGYFNPDNLKGDSYSIMMPPPNVTGVLHLGHAWENSLMDIMARYQRMQGKKVLLLPGTDHAAVATQAKVEKILMEKGIKNPRQELGREKLLEEIRDFSEKSKATILSQIKKMGTSCDWSRLAYTFDEERSRAVSEVFKKMYDDGLIYRGHRVVNWSVEGQCTCSDDELEYIERPAKLYTFKYSHDFPISIATTRPETKLGDTAVAVNLKDKRYKKYIGQIFTADVGAEKPLNIKIIADENIDMNFGTGAVGVTPAHSMADFEMYEKQKAKNNPIEFIQVIDQHGKMTEKAGKNYAGLTAEKAREEFIAWLKENKLLEKEEEITQNVGTSDRFGDVIESIPMTQWFVDVNKEILGKEKSLKELMRDAVAIGHNGDPEQKVKITPERFEKTYFSWIDNLRDWCISRQIWWGHQIPVWYDEKSNVYLAENQSVLLVRHGETDKNAEGFYGYPEDRLNENGKNQAIKAAKKIKQRKISRIISSPFPRSMETAGIISNEVGIKVEVWDELREVDEGILVGKKRGKNKTNFEEMIENKTGETFNEMFLRASKVWEEVENLGKQDGDIILVGHRGFHCILSASSKGVSPQDLIKYRTAWSLDNSGWEQIEVVITPKGKNLKQDPDTLDTWFSSGLWTFSTLGWPEKTKDLETFHPTNWMQMGYEILFFWMARMILMSTYTLDQIPFRDVYIHGILRDEKGRKFSKSDGNTLDPLHIIEKYGTDALRLSLISGTTPGLDSKFYEEKVEASRNFVNKLWNISRYILQKNLNKENLEKVDPNELTLADRWIIEKMHFLIRDVSSDLENFNFSQAGDRLHHFTWDDFADWYLEISKIEKNEKVKNYLLIEILKDLLKLWHPFMPFITENIWMEIGNGKFLMIEKWPNSLARFMKVYGPLMKNKISLSSFILLQEIIKSIRNARLENKIDPKKKIKVIIDNKNATGYAGMDIIKFLTGQQHLIKNLRTNIGELEIRETGEKVKNSIHRTVAGINIYIPMEGLIDIKKEKTKAEKELVELEKYISGIKGKLKNKYFVKKAPEAVVNQQKDSLEKAQVKFEEIKRHLKELK